MMLVMAMMVMLEMMMVMVVLHDDCGDDNDGYDIFLIYF